MLKARALFYALVVSLLIALVSGSLICLAHLQRQQQADQFNREHQIRKLNSGMALILGGLHHQKEIQQIDVFEEESLPIELQRKEWGFFDVGWVRVPSTDSIQSPTLARACLLGSRDNESLKSALYLCDRSAPLTLVGDCLIRGDAYLPANGVKSGYIDGHGFSGNQLIEGKHAKSGAYLPTFDKERVQRWMNYFHIPIKEVTTLPSVIHQSFIDSTLIISAPNFYLSQIDWKGNIVIVAKDSIVIDGRCQLEEVLLFAPHIVFKDRFEGSLQAFASHKLTIGEDCIFSYPSVLSLLKQETQSPASMLQLGRRSQLEGLLFSYQAVSSRRLIQVRIAEEAKVEGQVFVDGELELKGKVEGNVSCRSFRLQTTSSIYSNYLYNAVIDRSSLSPYFISGMIFSDHLDGAVLSWVE